MPAIKMVSLWEGSEHEAFVRNATQIKAIWLRHGASDFHIARMHTGAGVGQYEVTISFSDWEVFGRATHEVADDNDLTKLMAASHANGRMVSRNILVAIDLG
jgi:hypothetical protein